VHVVSSTSGGNCKCVGSLPLHLRGRPGTAHCHSIAHLPGPEEVQAVPPLLGWRGLQPLRHLPGHPHLVHYQGVHDRALHLVVGYILVADIISFGAKMDLFKWNIKRVEGRRCTFKVTNDDGTTQVLKTRSEVVLFLDQNKHIKLQPSDFVFKSAAKATSDLVDFSEKTLKIGSLGEETETETNLDTDKARIPGQKRSNVDDNERDKISAKIKRVTENHVCDHSRKFENTLQLIHKVRQEVAKVPNTMSSDTIHQLKSIIDTLSVEDDPVHLVKEICKIPDLFSAFKAVCGSRIETEMELISVNNMIPTPSMAFPPSADSNFYCDVVTEAFEKMPTLLAFLVNVLDSGEKSLNPSFVIRLATVICELLSNKESCH